MPVPPALRTNRRAPAALLAAAAVLGLAACADEDPFDPGRLRDDTVVVGELTLARQDEVDALRGVRRIVGDLELEGDHIVDFSGLETLEEVTGRLGLYWLEVPEGALELKSLRSVGTLHMYQADGITDLAMLDPACRIDSLYVTACRDFVRLPDDGLLTGVRTLSLLRLRRLEGLAPLADAGALRTLVLSELNRDLDLAPAASAGGLRHLLLDELALVDLRKLADFDTVRRLELRNLEKLGSLSGASEMASLRSLSVAYCGGLASLAGLGGCGELAGLELERCDALSSLSGLADLPALESLRLAYAWNLTSMRDLGGLPALRTLAIDHCYFLADWVDLARLPALRVLRLEGPSRVTDLGPFPAGLVLDEVVIDDWDVSDLAGLALSEGGVLDLERHWPRLDLTGVRLPDRLRLLRLRGRGFAELTPLTGLAAVDSLLIERTSITTCHGLEGLARIDGALKLEGNLDLASVAALTGLSLGEGAPVVIAGNARLDSCALADIVADWEPSGPLVVEDNGPCEGDDGGRAVR